MLQFILTSAVCVLIINAALTIRWQRQCVRILRDWQAAVVSQGTAISAQGDAIASLVDAIGAINTTSNALVGRDAEIISDVNKAFKAVRETFEMTHGRIDMLEQVSMGPRIPTHGLAGNN